MALINFPGDSPETVNVRGAIVLTVIVGTNFVGTVIVSTVILESVIVGGEGAYIAGRVCCARRY